MHLTANGYNVPANNSCNPPLIEKLAVKPLVLLALKRTSPYLHCIRKDIFIGKISLKIRPFFFSTRKLHLDLLVGNSGHTPPKAQVKHRIFSESRRID